MARSITKGYINLNDAYNQEITIQADFQTPIGTNQMLELGGKDIMRKAFSDFTYLEDMDGDGLYETIRCAAADKQSEL